MNTPERYQRLMCVTAQACTRAAPHRVHDVAAQRGESRESGLYRVKAPSALRGRLASAFGSLLMGRWRFAGHAEVRSYEVGDEVAVARRKADAHASLVLSEDLSAAELRKFGVRDVHSGYEVQ